MEDFLRKGSRVAHTCSAWCVVDFVEKNIITVTWRRMSRGMEATCISCMTCCGEEGRKFRHETACEHEIKIGTGSREGQEIGYDDTGEQSEQSDDVGGELDVDM